jgi:hypothetical protein
LYESGAQPVGYRGAEVPGVGGDHKRPARVERQPSSASRYTAGSIRYVQELSRSGLMWQHADEERLGPRRQSGRLGLFFTN